MPKHKPNYGLLDPGFVYVPANKTDISKTFERERQRLAEARAAEERAAEKQARHVDEAKTGVASFKAGLRAVKGN